MEQQGDKLHRRAPGIAFSPEGHRAVDEWITEAKSWIRKTADILGKRSLKSARAFLSEEEAYYSQRPDNPTWWQNELLEKIQILRTIMNATDMYF